jgi:hypothetical protein
MKMRSFADLERPTGLDVEMLALARHVAPDDLVDVVQVRRAVQFCSVGLGELPVHPGGVETPAAQVVAALGLESFVERRIHGWARLN